MAAPDPRALSRDRGPAQDPEGTGACLGPLEDLGEQETQELARAELTVLRKAQEFFQTFDAEGKGFIARTDMQVRGRPDGLGLPRLG